jgi:predicted dehydrogenase
MDKLRVGVIGTGRIAEGAHLPCLTRYRDVEVVLCDPVSERVAQVSRQFGIAATYTDHRQMLERERLDAAFVLTPPANWPTPPGRPGFLAWWASTGASSRCSRGRSAWSR